ncbi:Ion channel [Enhydrobacter aerosaccus]|uniref:Ion channel n=1 Tax=Enhydrobacter aerosaccus TaxID=225324 RepID=A0A1T4ST72_9HYPH|nr:potassium channel family protein [Enhydrobacter aerosaccus]SKA31078.1 Ion channel [Enhydrobacter aerosaccus]
MLWPEFQGLFAIPLVIATALIQLFAQYHVTRLPNVLPRKLVLWRAISRKTAVIVLAVLVLLIAHLVEVVVWAVRYFTWGELGDFANSVYFSLASFTTVGASELTLSPLHRFTGALEAAVGMMMFGWSTALLVNVIQRAESQQTDIQRDERADREES